MGNISGLVAQGQDRKGCISKVCKVVAMNIQSWDWERVIAIITIKTIGSNGLGRYVGCNTDAAYDDPLRRVGGQIPRGCTHLEHGRAKYLVCRLKWGALMCKMIIQYVGTLPSPHLKARASWREREST
jgi:hypothetical protein